MVEGTRINQHLDGIQERTACDSWAKSLGVNGRLLGGQDVRHAEGA